MTPLLGGALCACTFHFFYNSPTLAPLVALQAGLTVVGNATMWFAAWRVFEATKEKREAEDKEKGEGEAAAGLRGFDSFCFLFLFSFFLFSSSSSIEDEKRGFSFPLFVDRYNLKKIE